MSQEGRGCLVADQGGSDKVAQFKIEGRGSGPIVPPLDPRMLVGKCALLKDTTRFDPSGARTPDLWILCPWHLPPGHRAPTSAHVIVHKGFGKKMGF